MNYYAAKQRQSDKKWDYTCRNDDFTQPVGYCGAYIDWTPELLSRLGLPAEHPSFEKQRQFRDKHHSCGHETQQEAEACYREYLLDQRLKLMCEHPDAQIRCKVCNKWTTFYAEIDMNMWDLCEEHNNREEVEKLFEAPGEIWKS
jgi:hypothetical protein